VTTDPACERVELIRDVDLTREADPHALKLLDALRNNRKALVAVPGWWNRYRRLAEEDLAEMLLDDSVQPLFPEAQEPV
jgi:hypothetical protein